MLDKASDYRFVDVSDINITGDIWPKHHGEAEYKHPLKAEDMAFIEEGVVERSLSYEEIAKVKIPKRLSRDTISSFITLCVSCEHSWSADGSVGQGRFTFIPGINTHSGVHDFNGNLFDEFGGKSGVKFNFKTPQYRYKFESMDLSLLDAAYSDLNKMTYVVGIASGSWGWDYDYYPFLTCSGRAFVKYEGGSMPSAEVSFTDKAYGTSITVPGEYTWEIIPQYRKLGWFEDGVILSSLKGRILVRPDGSQIIKVKRGGIGLDYMLLDSRSGVVSRRIVWVNVNISEDTNEYSIPPIFLTEEFMMYNVFSDFKLDKYTCRVNNIHFWAEPDFKALTYS